MSDGDTPAPGHRVTGAEFRVRCEAIGLAAKADQSLAFSVNVRTVRRWENGDVDVPDAITARLHELEGMTRQAVDTLAAHLHAQARAGAQPAITIYQTNEALAADRRHLPLPEGWIDAKVLVPVGWWRVIVAHAIARTPALVTYADA